MNPVIALKQHVCTLAADPNFIHHKWFVAHHLAIIEQLVEELLEKYTNADMVVCRAMVWVHDWGKILTNKGADEEAVTEAQILTKLPEFGFSQVQVQQILQVYREMESLVPLCEHFMLETKIISSADAMSHYIGPFFAIYWYENSCQSVETLIENNLKKADKDKKKILLPEVDEAAKHRICLLKQFDVHHRPKRYLQ